MSLASAIQERIQQIRNVVCDNRKMEMANRYAEDMYFLIGVIEKNQRELDEWAAKHDPYGQKAKETVDRIHAFLLENGYGTSGPTADE